MGGEGLTSHRLSSHRLTSHRLSFDTFSSEGLSCKQVLSSFILLFQHHNETIIEILPISLILN